MTMNNSKKNNRKEMNNASSRVSISWYPGHMAKTMKQLETDLKLVDVVVEILDARIPVSSQNPEAQKLIKNKKKIVVLNKSDLANEIENKKWLKYFEKKQIPAILCNSNNGEGANKIINKLNEMMSEEKNIAQQKGRNKIVRAMIIGIPNVGKSSFINRVSKKTSMRVGNKPGVTKGKQWIKVNPTLELLDTPGILWPKFEDQQVGLKLAFTGAINDDILDPENMAIAFINHMISRNPDCLRNRYQITFDTIEEPHVILEKIAMARGFKKKGDEPDLERAGKILMDEYRGGKLGRLTLELPEDIDVMLEQKKARAAEKAVLDKERKKAYNNKKKK